MVIRSTIDFAVSRSWLLLPSVAAGAGAGFAMNGFSPVMAGGAALGLAPALAAGLALEMHGSRLRTADDVSRNFDLRTLGSIGRFKQAEGSAMPSPEYPEALHAYQNLASSLRASGGGALRTLLVTSAGAEEGKSTTAANLATVLAERGEKVILVDADLRWSSLRSTNASAASLGLSGLLMNYLHTPQLALVRTNAANLSLLPAGLLPPKPAELLASPRLVEVIAALRGFADYVIIDSPPVLEADDARLLAANVDATLLVMHAGKSRSRDVDKALRILTNVDARTLGAVLNQVKSPVRETAQEETLEAAPAIPALKGPIYAAPQPPAPALDPFSVEAFRKGPPKPVSANVPRPFEPEPEPAVLRLAEEGLTLEEPVVASTAAPPEMSIETFEPQRVPVTPTLRVVQPHERPQAPLPTDWVAVKAAEPRSEVPAATPAPAAIEHPVEGDVSVEEVLAHMEETLRLIREMRQEKSTANT
jgi:capsular exopolysaccharide synthesis family protein